MKGNKEKAEWKLKEEECWHLWILTERRDQRRKFHTVFQIWNVWFLVDCKKRRNRRNSANTGLMKTWKEKSPFISLCLLMAFSVSIPRIRQPHQAKQTWTQSYNAPLRAKYTAAILCGLELSSNLFPGAVNSTFKKHYRTSAKIHDSKYVTGLLSGTRDIIPWKV